MYIITFMSLLGVILNIKKNKICFVIWTFTNAFWCVIDFQKELYSQSVLFGIYFILAIYGLWEWRKEK